MFCSASIAILCFVEYNAIEKNNRDNLKMEKNNLDDQLKIENKNFKEWCKVENKMLRKRNCELSRMENAEFRFRHKVKRNPILRAFVNVFFIAYDCTSLSLIIRLCAPKWRDNLVVVDWHLLSWLGVTVISFSILVLFPDLYSNMVFVIPILIIIGWRWKDVITVWVTNHMLRRNSANNIRVLVLSAINVAEIIIMFSIWYFFTRNSFTNDHGSPAFKNPWYALRFSTDNLFESSGGHIQGVGLVPYYFERFTGILLTVIIAALIMSYFGNDKKS